MARCIKCGKKTKKCDCYYQASADDLREEISDIITLAGEYVVHWYEDGGPEDKVAALAVTVSEMRNRLEELEGKPKSKISIALEEGVSPDKVHVQEDNKTIGKVVNIGSAKKRKK